MVDPIIAELIKPIEQVARFIETGDDSYLTAFSKNGVTIIENFHPHIFEGENALTRWAEVIKSWHIKPIKLLHTFGEVHDVDINDDLAFISVATHWSGLQGGHPFEEDGGWAFVLVKEVGEWKVKGYGWSVIHYEQG